MTSRSTREARARTRVHRTPSILIDRVPRAGSRVMQRARGSVHACPEHRSAFTKTRQGPGVGAQARPAVGRSSVSIVNKIFKSSVKGERIRARGRYAQQARPSLGQRRTSVRRHSSTEPTPSAQLAPPPIIWRGSAPRAPASRHHLAPTRAGLVEDGRDVLGAVAVCGAQHLRGGGGGGRAGASTREESSGGAGLKEGGGRTETRAQRLATSTSAAICRGAWPGCPIRDVRP